MRSALAKDQNRSGVAIELGLQTVRRLARWRQHHLIDERAQDLRCLRLDVVLVESRLELSHFPPVELAEIGMKRNRRRWPL